jgi:hypothetical protein
MFQLRSLSPLSLATRIRRVGTLSLASLIAAGIVLILFSQNLDFSDSTRQIHVNDISQRVFIVGSQLSVQAWLALLGVTFGTLSYGLTGTYTHAFDWWCSWQAKRASGGAGSGLQYARYLNSQPQAPVLLGFYHGFPLALLGRYLVAALAVAASVGYKFAVIQVTYGNIENLPAEQVQLRLPPVRGIGNGTASPWLADSPLLPTNRAFFHTQNVYTLWGYETGDASRVPFNISLVGWANCSGLFHSQDHALLVTREIVMIANMTEEVGEQPFMTSAQGEWARVETLSTAWFAGSNVRAVVDYRIAEPGKVQVQWARLGSWKYDTSGTQRQRVERRVTYDVFYAVAEAIRLVSNESCSNLSDENGGPGTEVMARSASAVKTRFENGSVPLNPKLVEAAITDEQAGPREGVSVFVRGVMAGWAAQLADMETAGFRLGHAPPHSEPFGPEATKGTFRADLGDSRVEYPYYDGYRSEWRTGSYSDVGQAFFAVGIVALVLAATRIAMGPPVLTSWMGQHVRLALAAGAGGPNGEGQLASGYEVARRTHLDALRLVSSEGGTEARLVRLEVNT